MDRAWNSTSDQSTRCQPSKGEGVSAEHLWGEDGGNNQFRRVTGSSAGRFVDDGADCTTHLLAWRENGHARSLPPRPNVADDVQLEFVPMGKEHMHAEFSGFHAAARKWASFPSSRHPRYFPSSDTRVGLHRHFHARDQDDGPTRFAWLTSEWSLAPDTFDLLHHSQPFECDYSSLAAADGFTATSSGCGSGRALGRALGGSGDQDEEEAGEEEWPDAQLRLSRDCRRGGEAAGVAGERRTGRGGVRGGRGVLSCCSAEGCSRVAPPAMAPPRRKTSLFSDAYAPSPSVSLCTLHRRVRSGVRVAVAGHQHLGRHLRVRWCHYCKSAHSLDLTTLAQHRGQPQLWILRSKCGDKNQRGGPPRARAAAVMGGKRRLTRGGARAAAGGGGAESPALFDLRPNEVQGEWRGVSRGRAFEISVDAEPAALSRQPSTAWKLVNNVTALHRHDDTFDHEEEENLLSSVACAMLPGSTRLIFSAAGARLGLGPGLASVELARVIPSEGVMGNRQVTVSTFDGDPDFATLAVMGADEMNVDENLIGLAQGWSVTVDAHTKQLLTTPARLNLMPPEVTICPIVVSGRAFSISGLRGNERVHVFGQKMAPVSILVPPEGGSIRVTVPNAAPGSEPSVVPGFICVQVLAPNQPAAGTEFRRILVVDEDDLKDELLGLMRGAGIVEKNGEEEEEEVDGDNRDENHLPRRRKIKGFLSAASFNRFFKDTAWMLEAHWRAQLYTPHGRIATRRFVRAFNTVVNADDAPAMSSLLEEIVYDLDCQEDFENSLSDDEDDEVECDDHFQSLENIDNGEDAARFAPPANHSDPAAAHAAERAAVHANDFDDVNGADDDLSNVQFPLTCDQWIHMHQAGGLILSTSILISVLKSLEWGMSPVTITLVQIPGVMCSVFWTLSIKVASIRKLAVYLYNKMASGWLNTTLYDQALVLTVCCENAVIASLFPYDSVDFGNKWTIGLMCNMCCICLIALSRAENAPYKALRFDLCLLGALMLAVFYAVQIGVRGHALFLTKVAFSSFNRFVFWWGVVPIAVATFSRQWYRNELREAHRASAANKLKKLS